MANNRLYMVDTSNGERLLVAKSFCSGWYWRQTQEEMDDWLHGRDAATSYAWGKGATTLALQTENEELTAVSLKPDQSYQKTCPCSHDCQCPR